MMTVARDEELFVEMLLAALADNMEQAQLLGNLVVVGATWRRSPLMEVGTKV